MSEMAKSDSWSGLVEETRKALATLRAEDLDELAQRAQTMFNQAEAPATSHSGLLQTRPQISDEDRVRLNAEHRLLGDLLQATEKNLKVLRRLHDRAISGEVDTQWAR